MLDFTVEVYAIFILAALFYRPWYRYIEKYWHAEKVVKTHQRLYTFEPNIINPWVYTAMFKKHDADSLTFNKAMHGNHVKEYLQAMKQEVACSLFHKTWAYGNQSTAPNVLKSTWAFNLKQLPDGTAYKFKARFCCRATGGTGGSKAALW